MNNQFKQLILSSTVAGLMFSQVASAEFEVSGYVGGEARYYIEPSLYDDQKDFQPSINVEPEFAWSNEEGDHTVVFKPYYRYDSVDVNRSHGDIRELSWLTYADDWELKAGISKVYWGVAESVHLVDVINQTDSVESLDGEDKLGQPMVQFTYTTQDYGIFESYLLPYFRQRTFAGDKGRFRLALPLPLKTDDAVFQSEREEKHIDYALRWSNSYEYFDIGLGWFQGTNRTPGFAASGFVLNPLTGTQVPTSFVPVYTLSKQASVDLQATLDAWLIKFEAINLQLDDKVKISGLPTPFEQDSYSAAVTGFEYTFTGAFDTSWDLGVLAEYQYNSLGKDAASPAQNDIFSGARFAFNDMASTELLVGGSVDLDYDNTFSVLAEFSTRVADSVKMTVDAYIINSGDDQDLSYAFRRDDYVQVNLEYYF